MEIHCCKILRQIWSGLSSECNPEHVVLIEGYLFIYLFILEQVGGGTEGEGETECQTPQ